MRTSDARSGDTRADDARPGGPGAAGAGGPPREAPAGAPVTRRRFLKVTVPALGAAVLAAAGFAAFEDWLGLRTYVAWQWRGFRNHVVAYQYAFLPAGARIKHHFSDLTIDEDGLRHFLRDYEKYVGKLGLRSTEANRMLFSKFLLSSDFYRNGSDPKRTVRYVAFYDPYVSPCWNPFARA